MRQLSNIKPKIEKALWLLLILCLTIYAPIELTRLIVEGNFVWMVHPDIPRWEYGAEIAILWVLYIAGLALVYKRIK